MPLDISPPGESLVSVLASLAAGEATGEVLVLGAWQEGRLWLKGGRLVAARVRRARTFVDAVFELLHLEAASVHFTDGVEPTGSGDPTSLPAVVAEALARSGDWESIITVVPSLECTVALRPTVPGTVQLRPEQWRFVVTLAGGAVTVRDLLEALELSDFSARRGLRELVLAGVVSVTPPAQLHGRPRIAAPQAAVSAHPASGRGRLRLLSAPGEPTGSKDLEPAS